MPFLSSVDHLLRDRYIIFQKGIDNFAIEHKTCLFLVRGEIPFSRDGDFIPEVQAYEVTACLILLATSTEAK